LGENPGVIPDSFKQDLLNRIDIVDVVSRYVQLKKAGANFQGLCPFHSEKTASFTVSPAKQFYHCFGCGAHGNAIGFLMAYASLGYVDAVKDLAASAGLQVPDERPRSPQEVARKEREPDLYAVMEKAMAFYRAQLKAAPRAIEYLKRRGLTGEIAARFRIGYAPDGWQGLKEAFPDYEDKTLVELGLVIQGEEENKRYDRFRDRIMFPIFSARGFVIGFGGRVIEDGEPKYLNSPETPLFEKGREVYGLVQARDAIRAAGRVLVVEGYLDVVALAQFDVGYAVATLGTATTPVHVSKLLRLADEIVFSFDGDAAGRKAAWRALEVSLPLAPDHKPLRFLFLPDGEDPDTFIRQHGKEAFETMVKSAPTLSEFLVAELRSQSSLASAEGRSQFLVAARPHLQKITAASLKLQLVKEVARLAAVTQDEAEKLLGLTGETSYRRAAPPRREFRPPSSTEWKLLSRVVAYPALAAEIDVAMIDASLDESAALVEVFDYCGHGGDAPHPTQAMIIERFKDSPHAELMFHAQAFSLELGETEDQSRAFVRHAVTKLGIEKKYQEIETLRERLQRGELSKEEQVLHGKMISEVKLLERQLQADARGAPPK
jgi:DNA primase